VKKKAWHFIDPILRSMGLETYSIKCEEDELMHAEMAVDAGLIDLLAYPFLSRYFPFSEPS
jgi:hypothetical protein